MYALEFDAISWSQWLTSTSTGGYVTTVVWEKQHLSPPSTHTQISEPEFGIAVQNLPVPCVLTLLPTHKFEHIAELFFANATELD